jgi:hypothetical protein
MSEVYIPVSVQREVIRLANGHCEYCLYPERYSSDFFHFDHIISILKAALLNYSILLDVVVIVMDLKEQKHIISTL